MAGLGDRVEALSGVAELAVLLCARVVVAPAPCHALHRRHNFNHSVDCSLLWSHYFNFSASHNVKILTPGQAARDQMWHSHHDNQASRASVVNITSSVSHCQCSNAHGKPAELEQEASSVIVDGYLHATGAAQRGEAFSWTIDACWYFWFPGLQHFFDRGRGGAEGARHNGKAASQAVNVWPADVRPRAPFNQTTPQIWSLPSSTFGGFRISIPKSGCTRVLVFPSSDVLRAASSVLRSVGVTSRVEAGGTLHASSYGLIHLRLGDMKGTCGVDAKGQTLMRSSLIAAALSCANVSLRNMMTTTKTASQAPSRPAAPTPRDSALRDSFVSWMRAQASPMVLVFTDEEDPAFIGETIASVSRHFGWRARIVHGDALAAAVLEDQILKPAAASGGCPECRDYVLFSAVINLLKSSAAAWIRFGYQGICPSALASECYDTMRQHIQ